MTTKDQDLECYGKNLEEADKANYRRMMIEKIYTAIAGYKVIEKTEVGDLCSELPVMYGDACDYFEKHPEIEEKIVSSLQRGTTYTNIFEMLRMLWELKRLCIDSQNDDCIEYLYSLISK